MIASQAYSLSNHPANTLNAEKNTFLSALTVTSLLTTPVAKGITDKSRLNTIATTRSMARIDTTNFLFIFLSSDLEVISYCDCTAECADTDTNGKEYAEDSGPKLSKRYYRNKGNCQTLCYF